MKLPQEKMSDTRSRSVTPDSSQAKRSGSGIRLQISPERRTAAEVAARQPWRPLRKIGQMKR